MTRSVTPTLRRGLGRPDEGYPQTPQITQIGSVTRSLDLSISQSLFPTLAGKFIGTLPPTYSGFEIQEYVQVCRRMDRRMYVQEGPPSVRDEDTNEIASKLAASLRSFF